MECILHKYFPKRYLTLLEYLYRTPSSAGVTREAQPPNVLLFIGGLYDSFRSPGYVDDLAALFPRNAPNQKWRVMHVQLSSAGRAFGIFDLNRDVGRIPPITPVSVATVLIPRSSLCSTDPRSQPWPMSFSVNTRSLVLSNFKFHRPAFVADLTRLFQLRRWKKSATR